MTGMQGLADTARSSVLFDLSPRTATKPAIALPTESPVNITLECPVTGVDVDLPWIILMPGFDCYATDYTTIQHLLAERGHLMAIADQLHPTSAIAGPVLSVGREPQCSNTSFNPPTASIFEDVHSLLTQWLGHNSSTSMFSVPALPAAAEAAIRGLDVSSAVVVGHSAGGRVALDMVIGLCEDPLEFLCPNYTEADCVRDTGILKGIISWESIGSIVPTNAMLEIPDGVFVTYLSSLNNTLAELTLGAFDQTVGSCVSYIRFNSGDHYAITDWNPHNLTYQKAPCGSATTPSTPTTKPEQAARLVLIAELADASIRAQLLNDSAAADFLSEVPNSPLVHMADVSLQCYNVCHQLYA